MSKLLILKNARRDKRKKRIRANISGNAQKPRLSIFKSNRYFYAQAIDDVNGITICNVDGSKEKVKPTIDTVKTLAVEFAKRLKDKGITEAVYDRNGYVYHGVVASFAEALRENGIEV